jgi:hypothetical protein
MVGSGDSCGYKPAETVLDDLEDYLYGELLLKFGKA